MTDAPNRCEPPEEWRHAPREHWVAAPNGALMVAVFIPAPRVEIEPIWRLPTENCSPMWAYNLGWRYIAPVLNPDEIAAKVAEAYRAGQERMQTKCAAVALEHRSKIAVNEPLWHDGQDWAAQRISDAIEALPIQEQPE